MDREEIEAYELEASSSKTKKWKLKSTSHNDVTNHLVGERLALINPVPSLQSEEGDS